MNTCSQTAAPLLSELLELCRPPPSTLAAAMVLTIQCMCAHAMLPCCPACATQITLLATACTEVLQTSLAQH